MKRTNYANNWFNLAYRRRLRAAGAILLIVFGVAAFFLGLSADSHRVWVATRTVVAGEILKAEDLTPTYLPAAAIPERTATADQVVGKVVVAPITAGQAITELMVAGPPLFAALSGTWVPNNTTDEAREPYNMVALTVSDTAAVDMLQHGDVVTVLGAAEDHPTPKVIAAGARVILDAQASARSRSSGAATVVLSLPESQAQQVAAAQLKMPVTVVLAGQRGDASAQ